MSLRYLPEYAENALLALELARKEAARLQYTHRTLFALPIDAAWIQQLAVRDDLAEKVEAFVSRFGRLQDHIGEKLVPRFAALLLLSIVKTPRFSDVFFLGVIRRLGLIPPLSLSRHEGATRPPVPLLCTAVFSGH
jgi:hypothetical protein